MTITEYNIYDESIKGNIKVIKSPLVDSVFGNHGETPLHVLAKMGISEILEHPSSVTVNDFYGATPLHYLASPEAGATDDLTLDRYGEPYFKLYPDTVKEDKIKEFIKLKYPWFDLSEKKINYYLIEEIFNTQNAVKFILN